MRSEAAQAALLIEAKLLILQYFLLFKIFVGLEIGIIYVSRLTASCPSQLWGPSGPKEHSTHTKGCAPTGLGKR
jgi:hypothetical protein